MPFSDVTLSLMNSSQTLSKMSGMLGADMVMSLLGKGEGEEELIEPDVYIARDRGSTFVVVSMEEGQTTSTPWNNLEQKHHYPLSRQATSSVITTTEPTQDFRTAMETHNFRNLGR
jgi:hypothetical protein